MELSVGIAYPTALNHFPLAQTELNGLNAITRMVVSRKDNRIGLGIVFTLEDTMFHLIALFLVSLQRVQYGNLYIAIADDNTELAGLVLVKLSFVCFGLRHPFHIPAFPFNGIGVLQPMVVLGFQVCRTDILGIMNVLATSFKQADGVAPSTEVLNPVMMPCRHLI